MTDKKDNKTCIDDVAEVMVDVMAEAGFTLLHRLETMYRDCKASAETPKAEERVEEE